MDGLLGRVRSCLFQICLPCPVSLSQLRYHIASRAFSASAHHGDKKQVVVLGTGWSSLSFVKELDLNKYDLKVVSPRNYFTFTPLLTKISAGKISCGTCTEPIVSFLQRNKKGNFHFVHARCLDIDPKERKVLCEPVTKPNDNVVVPYDYLVVAVGAETNTFGIPGVEQHALFLKELEHAEHIYQTLVSKIEAASLPGIDEEEKQRLLHIVVVGGGPTGVELTGEIAVLFNEQVKRTFPKLAPYTKVTIVEGGDRLLATFTPDNSNFAKRVLTRNNVNVLLGNQVCAVDKDACTVKNVATGETTTLKCGVVVWASGLKPSKLVDNIRKHFKEQKNPRALVMDQYLTLRGNADRNIFVLGDCGKVTPDRLSDRVDEVIARLGSPDYRSLLRHRRKLAKGFPQLSLSKFNTSADSFKQLCEKLADENRDARAALLEVMKYIDDNYVPPFPTAQNAKQEGFYLSKLFNSGLPERGSNAFNEVWRGSLASIGGRDVVGNFPCMQFNGGLKAFLTWVCVYMMMLPSNRVKLCYALESFVNKFCGRHMITKQEQHIRN